MNANPHDRHTSPNIGAPKRAAIATTNPLSPSDLMMASTAPQHSGHESEITSTVALARINRLPLLQWLLAAINALLLGEGLTEPRPAGTLLECGRFVASVSEVWAHDWYTNGRKCFVMRCRDEASAHELAERLNSLLRP